MGNGLLKGLREKEATGKAGLGDMTGLNKREVTSYESDSQAVVLPVAAIVIKPQVRKQFTDEDVQRRAKSMETHGLLQPICVAKEGDKIVLVAGEIRLRAAKLLGWDTIRATFGKSGRRVQLAENLDRSDLKPYEIAEALQELKTEEGITSDTKLAELINTPQSYVSRYLGLLEAKPDVRAAIERGDLAASNYFNNTKLFKDGIPAGWIETENEPTGTNAPDTNTPGKKPRAGKNSKHRIGHWAQLSEPAARAVFALLEHHTKQLKLKPLATIGELDAKQATRLINERAAEIYAAVKKKRR